MRDALGGDGGVDAATFDAIWADATMGTDRHRRLLERRWRDDASILPDALDLWDRHRVVIGTEPAHLMDGGFRGRLHLVPEPPAGPYAKHLGWLRDAHFHFDELFAAMRARAPAIERRRFRTGGIVYGFFRSVGRTTPSAYASSWRIAYNVSGSLHASAVAVEDTLFHEIFHVNDEGDKWSGANLRAIHSTIVERCKDQLASSCLAPYAPTTTMVRGGTYYSFQPDNGDAVDEYGAEVATRWFQEHRALVEGTPPPKGSPWKCRTPENARAWDLVAGAFFAGVDLVPACK
jgi:hypothetical protein